MVEVAGSRVQVVEVAGSGVGGGGDGGGHRIWRCRWWRMPYLEVEASRGTAAVGEGERSRQ
jgi:hypothetical protein